MLQIKLYTQSPSFPEPYPELEIRNVLKQISEKLIGGDYIAGIWNDLLATDGNKIGLFIYTDEDGNVRFCKPRPTYGRATC